MAIVGAFETGNAFGKFSAVAVLDDGAGISYGICQFTHRSGALAAVLERYLSLGGVVGRLVIDDRLSDVRKRTPSAVIRLSADIAFRNALRAAGITDEMKQAQVDIASERFLEPAVTECSRLGFKSPLALAVVYDSMTHGSWEKLRDKVLKSSHPDARSEVTGFSSPPARGGVAPASGDEVVGAADGVVLSRERQWLIAYVQMRDAWLASIPRLAATRYRTRFFFNQIKLQNWELKLPVRVQGVTISRSTIDSIAMNIGGNHFRQTSSAVEPSRTNGFSPLIESANDPSTLTPKDPLPEAQPPDLREKGEKRRKGEEETCLDKVEAEVNLAATKYDQIERISTTVTQRSDAAKSLWTTVIGSVTQTFWALFGLIAVVPREIWLVVAIIAAALMLLYLYRQIELGRIREQKY